MVNARDFGLVSDKTAEDNYKALQAAVDCCGDVYIDTPGTYELDRPIVIHSNTHLHFGEGVIIKHINGPGSSYAFVNDGAYSGEFNENIEISGLHYLCNGVGVNRIESSVQGLWGHIAFFRIKNLVIRDFYCPDVTPAGYCIHICTFDNVLVENVTVEGRKDAVHFGSGKNFVVRHGYFRTFDDPIAINAHDYATANPELGWIENGLIEDCYDYDEDETTGFFCRILAGSWCDWSEGMSVQNSDTVVCNGRVYRVVAKPDGTVYKSVTPPSHEKGLCEYDGIRWAMIQDRVIYNCGCRNIHFKDIYLKKRRPVAFSIHFDNDNWSRSVYPGSAMPVQENLTFENIHIENETGYLLSTVTPAKGVEFKNITGDKMNFLFFALPHCKGQYPMSDMKLSGIQENAEVSVICHEGRSLKLTADEGTNICLKGDGKTELENS